MDDLGHAVYRRYFSYLDEPEIIMWCWGWKQRELYKYVMLQAGEEHLWKADMYTMRHVSGVNIWTGNGFLFIDVYDPDRSGKMNVEFSMIQKWRIHRKLKKLKQKLRKRRELGNYDSIEEKYLARMVEGTLTGKEAK